MIHLTLVTALLRSGATITRQANSKNSWQATKGNKTILWDAIKEDGNMVAGAVHVQSPAHGLYLDLDTNPYLDTVEDAVQALHP